MNCKKYTDIETRISQLFENFNKFKQLIQECGIKNLESEDELYKLYINQKMRLFAVEHGLNSFSLYRAEKNYYHLKLSQRKEILNAPSEHYLCKSIIMENTAFQDEYQSEYYQKYYCVIIQYTTEINSEKIAKRMRDHQNQHCDNKLGKKNFHFRLVPSEISYDLTGFSYNSVTPFAIKTKMPIVLSEKITELPQKFFYLGGGDPDIKIKIGLQEFFEKCDFSIITGDITVKTEYE